jgi:hypothetical protein
MIARFPPKRAENDSMSIGSGKPDSVSCFGHYLHESKSSKHTKTFPSFTLAPTDELFPHHYSENSSTKELSSPSMKYSEDFGSVTNDDGNDGSINFLKD